jgi:MFS transporter, FHS family, L-fucose permease
MVAIGALLFAIAARFLSFELMCFGQLVAGVGVASLEHTANPYMTNCGPVKYRVPRLLYGQSLAALGTVIAPQIAKVVLYGGSSTEVDAGTCTVGQGWASETVKAAVDLGPTIKLYYAMSGAAFGLAVVYVAIFFGTTLVPEMPQPDTPKWTHGWKFWKHPIFSMKYARVWFGCFVNFFNLGDQVTVAQFIIPTLTINACLTTTAATDMFRNAQILFLFGRLVPFGIVTAGACKIIRDSHFSVFFRSQVVLWVWLLGAVVLSALAATIKGFMLPWIAAFIMFCEAPSFPMIFEATTAGLGEWSTLGETMMVTSIAGGMVGAPAFGAIRDSVNISSGWWLVFAFFLLVLSFPTLTTVIPSWRSAVDQGEKKPDDPESLDLTDLSQRTAVKEEGESEAEQKPSS